MNTTRNLLTVVMMMAAIGLLAGPADAALVGELGILDVGGVNPATGNPWQPGDQYRFAFITSGATDATSSDINTYNTFVTNQAAASTTYTNLGDVNWFIMGSTVAVDARDNTGTNPSTDGAGAPIFLMDGSTKLADNNSDLWNGNIANPIAYDQHGNSIFNDRVFTGSFPNGTSVGLNTGGDTAIGVDSSPSGIQGVQVGRNNSTDTTWIRVWKEPWTSQKPVYAMSEVLTVTDPTKPDIFSVNFYTYGALPPADYDTVTLEAGQAAGEGSWNTTGWENIVVPWAPSSPQAPVTIATPRGSTATFTLKDARNGGPYLWNVSRSTLLGDGNGDLMDGHVNSTLDPGDGSNIFDMEVSDIPFDVYDVIVYLGGNQAQFGDGKGKIVFNGGPEQDFTLVPGEFAQFTEIVDGTTPGNYMVFSGVTGSSFTVQTWGMGNNGFNHLGPTGFQIRFHVPEPSTFALAALGLLGLGWCGRRRRERAA